MSGPNNPQTSKGALFGQSGFSPFLGSRDTRPRTSASALLSDDVVGEFLRLDSNGRATLDLVSIRTALGLSVPTPQPPVAPQPPPIGLPDHNHDADDITSGLLQPNRMGTGIADATKFLRGDRAWTDLDVLLLATIVAGQNVKVTALSPSGAQVDACTEDIVLAGVLRPPALTGAQHDYNPTGLDTASVLVLSLTGNRNITGIVGGIDGRVLFVLNDSTFTLTFLHENVNSTDINRFNIPTSYPLAGGNMMAVIYEGAGERWRLFFSLPFVSGTGLSMTGPRIQGVADIVTVNGSDCENANFSDDTPAAPAGGVNVKWQKDFVQPDNVSAHLDLKGETTGTAFPTGAAAWEGRDFYRTDLDSRLELEATRSKWLSLSDTSVLVFSNQATVTVGNQLRPFQGVFGSSTRGPKLLWDATLVSAMAFKGNTSTATGFDIRSGAVSKHTHSMAAGDESNNDGSINVDFSAGDIINVLVATGDLTSGGSVILTFRRRSS